MKVKKVFVLRVQIELINSVSILRKKLGFILMFIHL
jgi:hypothetical protein